MNLFSGIPCSSLLLHFLLVVSSGYFFLCQAIVSIATESVTINGRPAVMQASGGPQGPRNGPNIFGMAGMVDNDSTTCWIEGSQMSPDQGRWIKVKFFERRKIRGLIFGAGCRKDFLCLEEFSVPAKLKIKLDEKPWFDYTFDWDVKRGPQPVLSREEVNMRKALLWFDTDTAFTTSLIQVKFDEVWFGSRYANLSISDFELIEENDTRFELLNVLSAKTFNPNDVGAINSPLLLIGNDMPMRMMQVLDGVYQNESSIDWIRDSSKIENGLNAGMRTITDYAEISRLIGVLKNLFIAGNRMTRFLPNGKATIYMLPAGIISLNNHRWDIWRYITTARTSKGLELTIRYVPFIN